MYERLAACTTCLQIAPTSATWRDHAKLSPRAGLAALQAAIERPEKVRGVQLLDISLRMLHIRNQPAWKKPFVKGLQNVLRNTPVGGFFFDQVQPYSGMHLFSMPGTVGSKLLSQESLYTKQQQGGQQASNSCAGPGGLCQ